MVKLIYIYFLLFHISKQLKNKPSIFISEDNWLASVGMMEAPGAGLEQQYSPADTGSTISTITNTSNSNASNVSTN